MTLTVTSDGAAVEYHGTVVTMTATDADGKAVRIGVDHRPAQDLIEHLWDVGTVDVEVEPWQIVGAA